MKKLFSFVFGALFFFSCTQPQSPSEPEKQTLAGKTDYMSLAVLWAQRSAEARALYYQGYNMAKWRLEENLAQNSSQKPKAVVLDIDECVLDNSPFQGFCLHTGQTYSRELWKNWTDKMQATALPGAVEFTNFAKQKGVEVFYISNRRKADAFETTLENLKKEGFPNASPDFLLLRTQERSKKPRREKLQQQGYEIVLLIGDNLSDFSALYEERAQNWGFDKVDSTSHLFGKRYILLPNPMYGDWESAVYLNSYEWSENQKDSLRKNAIFGYK